MLFQQAGNTHVCFGEGDNKEGRQTPPHIDRQRYRQETHTQTETDRERPARNGGGGGLDHCYPSAQAPAPEYKKGKRQGEITATPKSGFEI